MGLHQSSPNKQLSTMKKCQHQQEINEVDSLMERSTEERDANIVQVISEHEEQLSTSLTELTSTNSPAQTTGGDVGRNVIERVTVHIQVPHWPTTASTFFYEKDTKLKYAFRDYAKFQLIRCSCILRFSINGVQNKKQCHLRLTLGKDTKIGKMSSLSSKTNAYRLLNVSNQIVVLEDGMLNKR